MFHSTSRGGRQVLGTLLVALLCSSIVLGSTVELFALVAARA